MNKNKDNNKPISIRLSQEAHAKMEDIMLARGLNKTEAIHFALLEIPILHIGNVENLATEFCKIRKLAEEKEYEAVREEVEELCHYIFDLIVRVENQKELGNY